MRYEDASHTGAFQGSEPVARDDFELQAAGAREPATGNVITGEGTQSGAAGADQAAGAKISAIAGHGGEDSSFSGGQLSVSGEHGRLMMDAEGNFSYRQNAQVENVRDRFTYTLADNQGNSDTATLIIEIGKTPVVIKADAQQIVPGPDGVVTLPAGVELSDVRVVGRNLVVDLPDGTQLIIIDGAVFVPQLVLNGVEVPATNVATLLIGQEIQPAAGETPPSSGGNFALPPPPLDPGVALGDLIPPTEYNYVPPEPQPTFELPDKKPEAGAVAVQLDDDAMAGGNPGGIGDDPDSVNASGFLPGSGGDGNLTWDLLDSGAPAGFSYVNGPNGSILVQQVQDGNPVTVLTITINPSTGAYTVTQNAAIRHAPGDNENNVVFQINYSVTDQDGDVALGSLAVNVDDDTPTVSVTAGSDSAVFLTTHDALTIGAGQEAVSTTANFSGVFNGVTLSPGADGAGSGTTSGYALTTTGGASGLTQGGVAINLYNVGGVIVGSTATSAAAISAANTVFTVSVTNTGVVTLTQFSQIDHSNTDPSPTGSPFEDHSISLADGAITLTRTETIVDRDGDSATGSASVQIGANLRFLDDGPSIGLADQGEPNLTVDETDLGINASASFAANFAASFGADGPAASGSITYALGINAGATGLVDVATGQPIVLVVNGGVVEGHVGNAAGALAFTVSVDASGVVTLDQIRALTHPNAANPDDSVTLVADNLITLTATARDFDGDTASATLNIGQNLNFEDDGPSISASSTQPTLVVDETVLATNASASFAGVFTSSFGADGAGTISYALGTSGGASGLVDTATGQPIVLVNNGGVIEGHVGNAAGPLAFTVSIDASGVVTLDQIRAVVHGDTTNHDEPTTLSGDGLVTITATITDRDGDQATATANIGQNLVFEDDGPSISLSGSEASLTVDETILATNATASFAGAFTPVFGADGPGSPSVTYALSITGGNGVASGLIDVATGQPIVLVNNAGVIEGHVGNAAGALAFTVSVDASGNVTLDQIRAVTHPNPANPDDSVTLSADNLVVLTATVRDGDGDTASAALNIGQNLNFEDDGPSANNDTDVTNPATDTATGNVITGVGTNEGAGNADAPGADGFNSITNLVGSSTSDNNPSGGFTAIGTHGTLQMDANGNYTYTRTGGAGGQTDTFTYTYVDRDGDPATATLIITISDETPVAGNVNVQLDDDALAGGNPGGPNGTDDPDAVNVSGNLPGSGGNAPLTWSLLTTGAPAGFSYVGGGTSVQVFQGATHVATITLTNPATGAYTVTQVAPIQHPAGADENNVSFTVNYTVTDADLDVANGTIAVNIDDDTPTVLASGTQPQLTVDETVLATNATASFAGVFTNSFGADGPAAAGSITYALAITGGNGVASGLVDVATGQNIVLVNNGGVIEGHVGNAAGPLAFTVSVDASGNVTLDQIRAVTHPNPANPDDSVTLSADNLITLTQTITDRDGDQASATANIGQNLNFEDDGPSISLSGTNPSLTVDETVLATNATASFAGMFTPLFGADGAAAANSLTYALGITGGNGVDSGLDDVATGQNIVLVNNGGVIEGHVGNAAGPLAFTVSVDASGNVTLDQIRAVTHPNAANPDDSVTLSADNLITLTATATDRDGDQASATANIGQNLNFEDDGPSISLSGTNPSLTVDETVLATNATASFAGMFTPLFGADGAAAANSLTYALGITGGNGVDSGLDDVATGQNIVLVNNGGVIEGHVGNAAGPLAFTVSVDASGNVTLDQIRAVTHPNPANPDDSVTLSADNLITLTATATDRDGDQASVTANIGQNLNFEDDGPSAAVSTAGFSISHDETPGLQGDANDVAGPLAQFAGVANPGDDPHVAGSVIGYAVGTGAISSTGTNFGADGGTAAFSLNVSAAGVDSGLNTTEGTDILLYKEGDLIVGRVGSQAGPAAFALSIDPNTGVVSMVQYLSIQHSNTGSADESISIANGAVLAVVTATDGDGDTSIASTGIGSLISFQDDGPALGVVQNQQTDNNPGTTPAVGTLHFTSGADGAGSTMTITADVTGLKSGGFNLVTEQVGNVLTAYQDTDGDGIKDAGETTAVFTLTVNPSAGTSGQYVFDLITPLDPTVTDTPIGGSSSFGAGPTASQILEHTDGTDLSVVSGYLTGAGFNEATWLATGVASGLTLSSVNGSTAGWGVASNNFEGSEFFNWDFGSGALDTQGGLFTPPPGVTLPQISTATFDMINYSGSDDIRYVVHFTDGTFVSGTIPAIHMDGSSNDPATHWVFTAPAGKFIADIEMFASGAAPGKVDLVSVGVQSSSLNETIDFTLQLTDGDGDPTSTAAFSVQVSAGLSPNPPAAMSLPPDPQSSMLVSSEPTSFSNDNQKWGGNGNGNGFGNIGNTGITSAMVAASGLMTMSHGSLDGFNQPSLEMMGRHGFQSLTTQFAGRESMDAGLANFSLGSEPAGMPNAVNLSGAGFSFDDTGFGGGLLAGRSSGDADAAFVPNYSAGNPALAHVPAFAPNVPTVSMASAEALAAAGGVAGVQRGGAVEQLLADALGHAGAPTVDALLHGLTGGGIGGLATFGDGASPAIASVPAWDMGTAGAFGAGFDMVFKMDAALLHHDVVQPAING